MEACIFCDFSDLKVGKRQTKGTSWFKVNDPQLLVSHECRLQYLFVGRRFGVTLAALNSGTVWRSQFFVKALGRALAAKKCPDHRRAFKKVSNRRFRRRKQFWFPSYSLSESVSMTPRHVCKTFRANIRRSDCVGPHFTSKVDPILKLSNYNASTQIKHVFRTKVQMFTPFFRDKTLKNYTCSESLSTR